MIESIYRKHIFVNVCTKKEKIHVYNNIFFFLLYTQQQYYCENVPKMYILLIGIMCI